MDSRHLKRSGSSLTDTLVSRRNLIETHMKTVFGTVSKVYETSMTLESQVLGWTFNWM